MTDYPYYQTFIENMAAKNNGIAWFAVGILLLVITLIAIRYKWPNSTSNPRTFTRIGIALLFLASLAYLNDWQTTGKFIIPITIFGLIANSWHFLYIQQIKKVFSRVPNWIWLAVSSGVIRLPGLWTESLWYDETFSAEMAQLPLEKLLTAVLGDVHPPGWYLIEHFTTKFLGTSEAALRFPSYTAGIILVLLIYRLTRALKLDQPTALIAGAIVTLLPGAIYYSNEARAYALLACCVIGMAICILENRPWLFTLAAGIALYNHNLSYIQVAIMGIGTILYRGFNKRWLTAFIPLIFIAIPGIQLLLQQSKDIIDGFWLPPITPGAILWPLLENTMRGRVPDNFVLHIAGAVLGLTFLSLFISRKWIFTRRGIVWGLLAFGTPALLFIISAVWKPVYLNRVMLPNTLALVIAWAYCIRHIPLGDKRALTAIGAPALAIAFISYFSSGRMDIREMLPSGCQGVTQVYNTSVAAHIMSSYYLANKQLLLWPDANDLNQSLSPKSKQAFGWTQATPKTGIVCLIDLNTPMSSIHERAYVATLLNRYPHITRPLDKTSLYTLQAHILDMQ